MKTVLILLAITACLATVAWTMIALPTHTTIPAQRIPPSIPADIHDASAPLITPGTAGTVPLPAQQPSMSGLGKWTIEGPANVYSGEPSGWNVALTGKPGGVWHASVTPSLEALPGRYNVLIQPPPASGHAYSGSFDVGAPPT